MSQKINDQKMVSIQNPVTVGQLEKKLITTLSYIIVNDFTSGNIEVMMSKRVGRDSRAALLKVIRANRRN